MLFLYAKDVSDSTVGTCCLVIPSQKITSADSAYLRSYYCYNVFGFVEYLASMLFHHLQQEAYVTAFDSIRNPVLMYEQSPDHLKQDTRSRSIVTG